MVADQCSANRQNGFMCHWLPGGLAGGKSLRRSWFRIMQQGETREATRPRLCNVSAYVCGYRIAG